MNPPLRAAAGAAALLLVGCQTTPTTITTNEVLEFQRMGQVAFDDPNAPLLPLPTSLFVRSPVRPNSPQCQDLSSTDWGTLSTGGIVTVENGLYCGFQRQSGIPAVGFSVSRCIDGCTALEDNLISWSSMRLNHHDAARAWVEGYTEAQYGHSVEWNEPVVEGAEHGLLCVLYVGRTRARWGAPLVTTHERCFIPLEWQGEVRLLNAVLQYRLKDLEPGGTRARVRDFLLGIAELYGSRNDALVAQQ